MRGGEVRTSQRVLDASGERGVEVEVELSRVLQDTVFGSEVAVVARLRGPVRGVNELAPGRYSVQFSGHGEYPNNRTSQEDRFATARGP